MIRIPHVETDITTACQLSCVGCNHHIPIYRKHGVSNAKVDQVAKDLNHLSTILHTDVWGALGGEPLLHKGLLDILKVVRQSQVCTTIEVWTNGLLLREMKDEFWRSFDILVLSVYQGKHDDHSIAWIESKCKHEGVTLVVKDERVWHNFRTLLEPIPTDEATTLAKYRGCFFRSFSRVANNGYFYTCCCAPHMPVLLQGRPQGSDGVLIEGLTEQGLNEYLTRDIPLGCCSMCAGRDTAKPIEWREERNPDKWIEASKGLSI